LFLSFLSLSEICVVGNPPKSGCVPFGEAAKHVGATDCVTGTVLHLENGPQAVTFLSFCNDAKTCRAPISIEEP
jgi:hypothetical protein